MTEPRSTPPETKKGALQVDVYGVVKGEVRPAAADAPPETWREVAQRVNRSLMRLAVAVIDLPRVTVEACNNLIRGLGKVPGDFRRRIAKAHAKSEQVEEQRQQQALSCPQPPAPPPGDRLTVTEERLQEKIDELRSRGIPVELRDLGNGIVAIIIARPDQEEIVGEVIRRALPAPQEPAEGRKRRRKHR